MGAVLVLGSLGVGLGVILGLADKFLKVEVDSRVEKINELLPQFNCGACGYPGCMGLAEAIVAEEGRVSDCKPIKPEGKEAIYEFIETAEGPNGEKMDMKKVK
ncbi:electron transport complex protein RnfB [Bacilli bacterium PM5-3]|nr:electron transport complex protein RnfB [Bacilli bacterium PM5-3]MDH6603888.1 electron transport complex protein RnfB [Bacilli bacterium PM5-9]